MSFLLYLRDRVLPYLVLICIIVGGFGGIGWLVAQTYFWNTSQLTILVNEDAVSVEMHIGARIVYRDLPLFQETYPFHIVIPYVRDMICLKECIFTDIPAGDAKIIFVTQEGVRYTENALITADTQGILDLRTPIHIQEIKAPQNEADMTKIDIPPDSIFYKNILQGLWLLYDKGKIFVYDTIAQQSILLPQEQEIISIVRGVQGGEYYLITDNSDVWRFDRYGRQKTEKITHSSLADKDLIWEQREGIITTKIILPGKERVFPGRLFWFEIDKKRYIFDGEKTFEIINT